MKEIVVNRFYNQENDEFILINAKYLVNDDVDLTNEIKLLDRNMKYISYNNKEKIVEIIRTIFSNYQEKSLQILCRNKDKIELGLKYKNGNLVKYHNSYNITLNDKLIFDYSYAYGIKTNIVNKKNNVLESNPLHYSNKIKDELYRLSYFNNVRIEKLTRDDLYIAKLYETLYDQKLDFDKENIKDILSSIMFLLGENGINLPENIYFCKNKNGVYSLELNKIISRLMLFDNIDVSNIRLLKNDIDNIKSLANLLKENNIDAKELANIIYDNKYRNNKQDNLDIKDKIKKLIK